MTTYLSSLLVPSMHSLLLLLLHILLLPVLFLLAPAAAASSASSTSASTAPAAAADIFCWHIHVYFLERNNRSTADALALHADFVSTFFLPNTTAAAPVTAARQPPTRTLSWPRQQPQPQPRRRCEKEVNDELCLWGCFDSDERCVNMLPTGPHTYGSWGVSIPNDQYNQVMPWVFRNNVKYADSIAGILLHPLTADRGADTRLTRKRDHEWGLWAPGRLPLDYDFLDHNVYDCTTCDPELCSQAC